MTGWVAKATPAVAVAEGWVTSTSLLAAAGLTAIGPEATAGRPPPVNFSAMVSALSLTRLLKVATPLTTATWVVPCSGPDPVPNAAVIVVRLSAVSKCTGPPRRRPGR